MTCHQSIAYKQKGSPSRKHWFAESNDVDVIRFPEFPLYFFPKDSPTTEQRITTLRVRGVKIVPCFDYVKAQKTRFIFKISSGRRRK